MWWLKNVVLLSEFFIVKLKIALVPKKIIFSPVTGEAIQPVGKIGHVVAGKKKAPVLSFISPHRCNMRRLVTLCSNRQDCG